LALITLNALTHAHKSLPIGHSLSGEVAAYLGKLGGKVKSLKRLLSRKLRLLGAQLLV
jgi:hypothetical protein